MQAQTVIPGIDESRRVKAEQRLLETLRLAVANISIKELAFELDVSPSLLADSLAERSNKGVRASWLITIIDMATLADAVAIIDALGDMKRLACQKRRKRTPEELNERYEDKFRSMGPVGMQLLLDAQGEDE